MNENAPVYINDNKIKLAQTTFLFEQDNDVERDDFSNGTGRFFGATGQQTNFEDFSPNYTIPEGEVGIAIRGERIDDTDANFVNFLVEIDGQQEGDLSVFGLDSLGWRVSTIFDVELSGDSNVRLEFETEDDDGTFELDIFGIIDLRFENDLTFDNEVHEPSGYLDGPELRPPSGVFIESKEELADTNIASARLNASFNDHTKGNQALQLSFDQGETYFPVDGTEENTQSIEVDAATTGLSVEGRGRMSAFPLDANDGTPQNTTPRFGYDGHEIDTWTIDVDTDNVEILFDQEFNDNRLATISNIADSSNQFFRWEGDVCRIFKQGEESTNVELKEKNITSTTDIEDTYSSVQVKGRGGVESPVIESDNAPPYVNRHKEIRGRDIESEQDARRKAIEFIADNGEIIYEGDIDTLPTRAPLGEEMDGELFSHGKPMFIERVNYSKRSSSISLGRRRDLGKEIMQLERSKRSSEILDTS